MTNEAILAIDAGTTGITVVLVDREGVVRARGYTEFAQFFPQPGWVEHDAEGIWLAVLDATSQALAVGEGFVPTAIGIANQRETCLFWDRSGRPLHRAIVWQCRRSAAICAELRDQGLEPQIARRTGLRLDPYFSGTKALWLTRNDPSLASHVASGDVMFGTIDTWLAYKLSGGAAHVTDATNASRTLCFDIKRMAWDEGLLGTFGLNSRVMAQVVPSSSAVCATRNLNVLPDGLPVAGIAGDQQAALYGQACFEAGLTKGTYGTGCFILTHTGPALRHSDAGLLTTVAATADGSPAYALEGSIFVAGAALQWCRDNLKLFETWQQGEALAASVPNAGGVVFVPAFVGLGSPHWAPDARGTLYGLTRGTTPAHIARAALDSMAFQAQDALSLMAADAGTPLTELRVDGGAAANDALMQLQADLLGVPVSRPASVESTALGAAYLAGLATGFWRDESELASLRRVERRFESSRNAAVAQAAYARWGAAVAGLLATELPALDRDLEHSA
jgi:glycerol kinase